MADSVNFLRFDLTLVTLRNPAGGVKSKEPVPPWEKLSVAAAPLAASCSTGYNLRIGNSAPAIRVKVLFFGRLKEIAGRSEDVLDLAEGAPIEMLFARCVAQL